MTDGKKQESVANKIEREYIIPLRREWRKTANYRRAGRAIREIKRFIARHMKVPDHDVEKVKLDQYLNNEVWFRGKSKPPAKIKVKARKEGELVYVSLAELPEIWAFHKTKHEKQHKKSEEKPTLREQAKAAISGDKKEESKEEKTEEEVKSEKEKEASVAEAGEKLQEAKAKQEKHTSKDKMKPQAQHRTALNRH